MFGKTEKMGVWPSIDDLSPQIVLNFIWALTIFYLFYFYFIRFFERRQFVKYLILSVVSSVLVTFLFLPFHRMLFEQFEMFNYLYFAPPMFGTFIIAQCGCLIRGFENWFTDMQLKKELENRNLKNELELLKSQVNPHFLFNTLNNIDSLIHNSPKGASDALITLSDMLRYMIYETPGDKVPLSKEIAYIRNYIKLQSLRFRNSNYVKFNFPQDCSSIIVAPMLLIPFIENAFKYASEDGNMPVIDISLLCNENQLTFVCTNKFNYNNNNLPTGGVGIENAKRRLQLIYPDNYELRIDKENNIFKVELEIKLK
jgi:hypothetical protein